MGAIDVWEPKEKRMERVHTFIVRNGAGIAIMRNFPTMLIAKEELRKRGFHVTQSITHKEYRVLTWDVLADITYPYEQGGYYQWAR